MSGAHQALERTEMGRSGLPQFQRQWRLILVAHLRRPVASPIVRIRHFIKKAPSGQFLWGAFALTLATLLTAGQCAPTRTAVELDRLQGHWEGEGAGGKCSITITGNSLHYRAGTNWWKTTFILPAGTDPQQLHATIKDSSPPTNGIGTVVFAIFKIEDATLTLAEVDGSDKPPETFDSASSRYVVKKAQPPKTK